MKKLLTAFALSLVASASMAADTIKVGVLHSLSGTMAISETTLKDTVLMMVEDQNKKGGLLGKNWNPWLSTRRQIGHCLRKKRVSC